MGINTDGRHCIKHNFNNSIILFVYLNNFINLQSNLIEYVLCKSENLNTSLFKFFILYLRLIYWVFYFCVQFIDVYLRL